jgi:hypothetical protein
MKAPILRSGPATVVAALISFASLSSATDQFTITPDYQKVCPGELVELTYCSRPGDTACLAVSQTLGTTSIPGVGVFNIALDPYPIVLPLPVFPASGCFKTIDPLPCNAPPGVYYLQAASMEPVGGVFLISNLAAVEVSTDCQDWDDNGVPDSCDPDCDGDGVIDGLEIDSDGDDVPNDCDSEVCEAPEEPCDGGCWKMLNKPLDSGGPVGTYGLRLDGLFGDGADAMYTFSFEEEGTDVQMCYDKGSKTLTIQGVVYGGLGLAPSWDADMQSFGLIEFTWKNVKCKDGRVVAKKDESTGDGSFTWLATGEVIDLDPKADANGEYAYIDHDFLLHGWVAFDGMPEECCQDFKTEGNPLTTCP